MAADLDAIADSLAGRYTIERAVGSGGMATVYRAHDVRHDRPVALKVLRPELSAVIGAERFLREIRTTANLQHPHILPLFDSGEAGGLLFYVMPFVAGESLRDRLAREKQLGVEESVRLASEVASALDYAHRQGIVHRDIKPANILLHDGSALVADFGIALAVRNAGADRITETGLSLGTPHYMSPEQATGDRDPDARSDVYSLAAVLYEMLAGEPPHTGSTVQAVIAKVLTEPVKPVRDLRHSVPVHVALAVEQALAKIPADRFDSAGEFAKALHDPAVMMSGAGAGAQPAAATIGRHRMQMTAVAVATLVLGLALGWLLHRPAPTVNAPRVVFEIAPDSGSSAIRNPAMSPDGSTIVYVETAATGDRLMVRRVGETRARALPGTEGGYSPFFSPDGEWVAFASEFELRKIRLDGGVPITVAPTPFVSSGVWASDGTIVYSVWPRGLLRVAATGGKPVPVQQQDSTRWLILSSLTDDERAIVAQDAGAERGRTILLDVATGEERELGPFAAAALVRPDALAYVTLTKDLVWQRFEHETKMLTGPAVQLDNHVALYVAGSKNGALAYMSSPGLELALLDRRGDGTVLVRQMGVREPRFSPDARRLTYSAMTPGTLIADLWVRDLAGGIGRRLTNIGTNNLGAGAQWSPDGRRFAFSAKTDGSEGDDLFIQGVDGDAVAEPLLRRPGVQMANDWSPDGTTIVFLDVSATGNGDIWSVPASGGEPTPFLTSPADEGWARLSPDGRWIAYCSNETGHYEVYVQSFPDRARKTVISVDGGCDPAWRGDGRELFYWHGNQLVAVALAPGTDAGSPAVIQRETLFEHPYRQAQQANYDVSPDGQSFAVVGAPAGSGNIVVMLNAVQGKRP